MVPCSSDTEGQADRGVGSAVTDVLDDLLKTETGEEVLVTFLSGM